MFTYFGGYSERAVSTQSRISSESHAQWVCSDAENSGYSWRCEAPRVHPEISRSTSVYIIINISVFSSHSCFRIFLFNIYAKDVVLLLLLLFVALLVGSLPEEQKGCLVTFLALSWTYLACLVTQFVHMHISAFFITPQTGLTTALSKVAGLTVGFRGFRTSIFNELEHRYRVKTAVHFYYFIFSSIIPIGILVVVVCCCCFLPLKGPSHINYVINLFYFIRIISDFVVVSFLFCGVQARYAELDCSCWKVTYLAY